MKTTARATCKHPGCTESAFWSFDTRKEAAAHYPQREKWRCLKHTHPEKVLSVTNLERTVELTSMRSAGCGEKDRFWHDGTRLGSGFNHSDAHYAYASEFPDGTKLIITARIELPTGGGGAELVADVIARETKSGARSATTKLTPLPPTATVDGTENFMPKSKAKNRKRAAAVAGAAPCSATLRGLLNTFRRMGDDANHVRLRHLKPRRGSIKADTKIRDEFAAAASAYYNCMRHVQVLLPSA